MVYCDPPYDGTFSGYHTDGFTEDDQYHLVSVLEYRLSEGHPVIVSNSDTSLSVCCIEISLTTTSRQNAASACRLARVNLQQKSLLFPGALLGGI